MLLSLELFVLLASLAQATPLIAQHQSMDYNQAPPNLTTLPAQSLFSKWRPIAHFLAPSGHVGDPMAAFVDPSTGLFHQGYLYTPFNQTSGNGAAAATTSNLVEWKDVSSPNPTTIESGGINDPLAVFDGTVIPNGYRNQPTLIYTAVSFLPISWTLPYIPGSEAQAIAVSSDNGRNFTKLERGPVLPSAPFGLNVTGWRDPYVFQNPQFDRLLNSAENVWYISVTGGVHGVGPSLFLYRQYHANFTEWEYMGEWWKESANTTWGDGLWAGRWGFNFEVGNVFGLDDQGENPNGTLFTFVGTEGSTYGYPGGRAQLWASGQLDSTSNSSDPIHFDVNMAGVLDWGKSAYAASSKVVPASSDPSKAIGAPDRQIAVLWITQDFYGSNSFPITQQGWDGQLTLPRELTRKTIYNVVNDEAVQETGSWRIISTDNADNSVDITTLGISPAREVVAALTNNTATYEGDRTINNTDQSVVPLQKQVSSNTYYMSASLSFPSEARNSTDLKAGFRILSSQYESTTIYYQFSNESLIVDRSNSSAAAMTTQGFDTRNEAGRLRLWDIHHDGYIQMESLDLRIVVDHSVVEIYANDRFVLSTLVFPWYESSKGIEYFHEGSVGVKYSNVTVFDGLFDAWPERSK